MRDSQAGSIPGATVRVVNEDTNAATDAVTDAQGAYRAEGLAPGRYRVEVGARRLRDRRHPPDRWRRTSRPPAT